MQRPALTSTHIATPANRLPCACTCACTEFNRRLAPGAQSNTAQPLLAHLVAVHTYLCKHTARPPLLSSAEGNHSPPACVLSDLLPPRARHLSGQRGARVRARTRLALPPPLLHARRRVRRLVRLRRRARLDPRRLVERHPGRLQRLLLEFDNSPVCAQGGTDWPPDGTAGLTAGFSAASVAAMPASAAATAWIRVASSSATLAGCSVCGSGFRTWSLEIGGGYRKYCSVCAGRCPRPSDGKAGAGQWWAV